MARFFDSLKRGFDRGGMLQKIIYVNVGVFLILRLGAVAIMLAGGDPESLWISWVELPSSMAALALRPWTPVTYMFAQYDVLHILFNMLWLYWFGRLFLYVGTPRQLFGLYLLGGLGGAAIYMAALNLLPYFQGMNAVLLGSSASVIAVVTATAWRMPDYRIGLLFIGNVALKWIAAVTVLLSLLNIPGENAGGNIAHLGGAFVGMAYGIAMARGRDITRPINMLIDGCVDVWRRLTATKINRASNAADNRTAGRSADRVDMDAILDKIKKSGYASLTADERQRLFDVSRKIK